MNSFQLHQKLKQHLTSIKVRATKPQRTNLALWSQALAVSPNCHLATPALGLPLSGRRENIIQRLRRSLKNKQMSVQSCYQPIIRNSTSVYGAFYAHYQETATIGCDSMLDDGGSALNDNAPALNDDDSAYATTTQCRIYASPSCFFSSRTSELASGA